MNKNVAMIAAAMFAALVITAPAAPLLNSDSIISAKAADRPRVISDFDLSGDEMFTPSQTALHDADEIKACAQFALCKREGFRVLGAAKSPDGDGWVFLIQNDTCEWHELAQTDGKACSGIELEYYREFCPSELSNYPAVLLDVNAFADAEPFMSMEDAIDRAVSDSRSYPGEFTVDHAVFDAQTNGWRIVLQSTDSSVRVEYVFAANEPLSVHVIQ